MGQLGSPSLPEGWTVVDFDEDDPYNAWCSEESPEPLDEDDPGLSDGAR